MRSIIAIVLLSLFSLNTYAQQWPLIVQLKYSPFGTINPDEDEFEYFQDNYERYDLDFERSLGAKLILEPFYISANKSITSRDNSAAQTTVETLAIGFGGIRYDQFAYDSGLYLLGSVGVGTGWFKFNDQKQSEQEAMAEANAEIGFRLQEHFLLGMGVDYQLFGSFGETKANYWNLYVSTGLTF